jgi:hypothetical protein
VTGFDLLVWVTGFDSSHLATASSAFSSGGFLLPAALLDLNTPVSRPWDPV